MFKKDKGIKVLGAMVMAGGLATLQMLSAVAAPTPTLNPSQVFAQNSSANDLFQQGVNLYQRGNLAEAETAFRKALQIDPNFAEAQANLGSILANQNKISEAIPYFEAAIRLKPDLAVFHYQLGLALYLNSRPADAINPLKKARDLLRAQGKTQEAETIEQALQRLGAE